MRCERCGWQGATVPWVDVRGRVARVCKRACGMALDDLEEARVWLEERRGMGDSRTDAQIEDERREAHARIQAAQRR